MTIGTSPTPGRTHRHCHNLAAVDVAKGVCHRTKTVVISDAAACEHFDQLRRCGGCAAFESSPDPFLGTCGAAASRPMAYPDMIAVTCEHFRPIQAEPHQAPRG